MPVGGSRRRIVFTVFTIFPDARGGACLASTCIHGGNEGEL